MDYKGKNSFLKMFLVASSGFFHAFKTEKNIRIQLFCAVIVIIFAFILHVSTIEWLVLVICIGGVLSLELLNTALERVVDLASNDAFHMLAKQAKDVAASAVLLFSICTCIIAGIIFIPKIFAFF